MDAALAQALAAMKTGAAAEVETERKKMLAEVAEARRVMLAEVEKERMAMLQQLDVERTRLGEVHARLEREEATVRDAALKTAALVRLNVGGRVFTTSRMTLQQSLFEPQATYFSSLFVDRLQLPRDDQVMRL